MDGNRNDSSNGVGIPVDFFDPEDYARPQVYGECADMPPHCWVVSCRHNLWLDVHPITGLIKLNFPGVEPEDVGELCSLKLAAQGERTEADVGQLMNTSKQNVGHLERRAIRKLGYSQQVQDALGEGET